MEIKVFFDPVFHIVINNMYDSDTNKNILKEAVTLQGEFNNGLTGGNNNISKYRSNTVAFYDDIYCKRYDSELLKAIDISFINPEINDLLSSSVYPVSEFPLTDYHETQVSRYGCDNQRYDWHLDRLGNNKRMLTMVYYFNEEPKKYKGGQLQFTNSPIIEGKTVIEHPNIKTIQPENNMCVFFGATTAHRVLPTTSPEEFSSGRFSVNCWIGNK